jgi:predicted nucleic acid-binding protein
VSGTTFALDSSCMVAAVCSWHEHHAAAVAAIERRLDRGEHLAVAAHALVESYAVLTRLPAPHRLAPDDAWTLLKANFAEPATVVALSGPTHITLLGRLAKNGIGGGRSYDALIAMSASQGNVKVLLTFNPRHFDPAPDGVAVIVPAPLT